MSERRKHIPLKAQLHAALYQLGFEPHEVHLDHDPALALREWDEAAQDTIPPASDPRYLVWRPIAEHKTKTFGTPATTAGSDIHAIAKVKRMVKDPPGGEEFRRRLLSKADEPERQPKQKPKYRWGKRPFPKVRVK